jgi:predicted CXXCH cytochrome family protein
MVHAQTGNEEPDKNECADCHEITQNHWAESSHGQAFNNTAFQMAWREQNSPEECLACHTTGFNSTTGKSEMDSVSCSACHGPEIGEHPEKIMPTDVSSELCGTCHLDTHDEWETSGHAAEDLTCVRCHNAHTTELRTGDVDQLCQSCHNETAHYYDDTVHAAEGLLCSDCHLRVSDTKLGEGHGQRSHTFTVDLATCTSCHNDEMHIQQPSAVSQIENNDQAKDSQPVFSKGSMPTILKEAEPVGPMGFAILAVLVGMGFGIVAAPWLAKKSKSSNKGKRDE